MNSTTDRQSVDLSGPRLFTAVRRSLKKFGFTGGDIFAEVRRVHPLGVETAAMNVWLDLPAQIRASYRDRSWWLCYAGIVTSTQMQDKPTYHGPNKTDDGWIDPDYEAWCREHEPEKYDGLMTVRELRQEIRDATTGPKPKQKHSARLNMALESAGVKL